MSFFKRIASSPDEGPGQTRDCDACASDPGFVTSPPVMDPGTGEELASAVRITCPWCHGTTKVHR